MRKMLVTALLFLCALVQAEEDFEEKLTRGMWFMYECQRESAECKLIVDSSIKLIVFMVQLSGISSKDDQLFEKIFELKDRRCVLDVTPEEVIKEIQGSFRDARFAALGVDMMVFNSFFIAAEARCKGTIL
ncbi:MAG: hypothetical protein K2W88_15160 [Pararheinheimera sp.]|nr:hypothetical protein [Rheinheimera sp.]